jgi:nitrous oxidase accessory protein NosD
MHRSALGYLGFLAWAASCVVAAAATLAVDCDAGGKLGEALAQARPGDVISVRGACRESVLVASTLQNVTLQGDATITGPEARRPVILILGREIVVRGLRLTGGRNGLSILRGASAVIDGVTIEDTGIERIPGAGLGINIGQHAFAAIVNSTIQRNWNIGILVHENSAARIGFIDVATVVGANTIAENGVGILLTEAAQARVTGASLIRNVADGIRVEKGSHLEVAGNVIEENGGSGVVVTGNSGAIVRVGQGIVAPNTTRAEARNRAFGITCWLGGYVSGRLGSLAGLEGTAKISDGCANGLSP